MASFGLSGDFIPTAFKHFVFQVNRKQLIQNPASKHKFLLDAPAHVFMYPCQ